MSDQSDPKVEHPASCVCNGMGVVPDRPWQPMRKVRTSIVGQSEGYHRRALPCPMDPR